jgi:Tol biopolymer transport system component
VWFAVKGQTVRRLTPPSETDYSPAISTDGQWLAAATGSGRTGGSDVLVMRSSDGLQRRIVAKNGGWPAFSRDGRSVFFHRQNPEGW